MPKAEEIQIARRAAAGSDPSAFVREWLLSSNPFAFRSMVGSYTVFRTEAADLLGVHAAQITLVGSSQLGFSLRPDQLLRPFRNESDIDVVIVSSELFDATWDELVAQSVSIVRLDEENRRRFKKVQAAFFHGFLRPDLLPTGTKLARDWFPKLAGPFRSPIAARHPVKAWLFKGWWHFEHFYADGLARIQPQIVRMLET